MGEAAGAQTRAAQLAEDVEATAAEVVAEVEAYPEAAWRRPAVGAEGWSAGLLAQHIALGYRQCLEWLRTLRRGEAVAMGMDDMHRANAANQERPSPPKAEVVAFVRAAAAELAGCLRQLSDEELTSEAYFGPGEAVRSVADVARLAARHARVHLQSLRAEAGPAPRERSGDA